MVRVRATDASSRYNIKIRELKRCASPNEIFEVSDSRFVTLSGKNQYHIVFVIKEEVDREEEAPAKKKRSKKVEEEK